METHGLLHIRALPILGHIMLYYDCVVHFSSFMTSLDTGEFKVKDFLNLIDDIFYSVKYLLRPWYFSQCFVGYIWVKILILCNVSSKYS